MLSSDLIDVLCAAHLTYCVESDFEDRGGIILVGAPGTLKSTFLSVLDKQYANAVAMSDINARGLADLRDQISNGGIRTIVLPELAKIYERAEATASNVEGTLRAMAGEGFQAASFEDQRVNRIKARALVIGAMTSKLQSRKFTEWEDSGFNRRFLWCLIQLADPDALIRSVVENRAIDFSMQFLPRPPLSGRIPNTTTAVEHRILEGWIKYQPGGSRTLQLQLMVKILAVLRWWYDQVPGHGGGRDGMATLCRFAECLGKTGGGIELPTHKPLSSQAISAMTRKINKAQVSAAARRLSAASQKKRKR